MPLPSSGAISLSQVNVELGRSATAAINMNESAVRTLFGKASGAIAMSDGYGKANEFAFAIASNQTNANLRTLALNAGWNGASKVIATINSGVVLGSNATGTPGLTVNGSFPNGVALTNNGFIVGRGGNGASGRTSGSGPGNAGNAGGLALLVASPISITNSNTIAGGGGGGGSGGNGFVDAGYSSFFVGGGGGGGGRSNSISSSSGGSGGSGTSINGFAGGSGNQSSAGNGGNSGTGAEGRGGTGGNWGTNGNAASSLGGQPGGGGGAAGAAISGNSNITWVAFGTRLGAIA